ncbi:ubiquitin carboxyl-terminal hydrolase 17 [Phtheirospermum japonicum]|uniref:Ubiquitin carboxyl-terminal hydrolase 17 n=1 Tax=Phtheirospermum japonicum TaxID=374723 RepID=A0A830D8Q1_9LAMI|nr:ubiquitin carboxyl-terminal hydrolase 17 [Phtheirospermum japonicum]
MLVIVGILLIFGLVVRHKWKNGAAKKEEILRLVAVASEEEEEIAKLQCFEDYNSPPPPQPQLENQYYCAVCHRHTTTRCARCKAVRYCRKEVVIPLSLKKIMAEDSSGKCQIIHWRQGHKDECRQATALHSSSESGYDLETASENQFAMHLKNEGKICSGASQEFNDSRSSNSSTSCFFSSTERSDSSFDASVSDVADLGTPIQSDKAPSVGIGSHTSKTNSGSDDADVPSPSLPVYSVNHPPRGSNIEKASANKTDESLRSTSIRDKRKGDRVALSEEFGLGATESRSSQSSSAARTSTAEDWKFLAQMSASKMTRSIRAPGNHQMLNVELSSECSKSLKTPHSDEYWKNELQVGNSNETRSIPTFRSAGNCQKLPTKTSSTRVVSSEIEGVRNMLQDTKSLKTSVRKFVQHFKAPKQSKSYTFDMLKDPDGTYNHKTIFPLKLFMQLYTCDDVELHPFGLVNSAMQMLCCSVSLILGRLLLIFFMGCIQKHASRKRDWCFICKFEHLIQRGQATSSPSSPVGLLSQIQPIGREEDAHEFLRLVSTGKKMQSTCLEEAGASGSLSEDSTLMGLTFGGYLRSKIKCMKCLGRSERYDRMMDLTVEIDGNICTLEDALTQFTTSETLGGDDKYKCSRCKSYEKAKKKLTVLEAPNILTIVLKRFRSGNLEKLNKLVKFPEVLNLSPYMSGMNDKYPVYHLYAVVVHLGLMNTAYSGHYVSYVKDFQGDWLRIDDSKVSHVDLEAVLSVEAYILFYARHTPRRVSFVRNSSSYSDVKTKRNMEAISSSNNAKKKISKTTPNSCNRNTESALPHQVSGKHPHWVSPSDFTGDHVVEPDGWGFHPKHRNPIADSSSSDSSSIFSTSDAGSYSTDSTKDSSAEDLSGYLFGSSCGGSAAFVMDVMVVGNVGFGRYGLIVGMLGSGGTVVVEWMSWWLAMWALADMG